jgi:hemerythrin-like domain-containing protein
MSKILDVLHAEHSNTVMLLNGFEKQIDLFATGQSPDYELIEVTLDYLAEFPDEIHHPKEDLIYRKLKLIDPKAEVIDLPSEHEDLAALTRSVRTAIRDVLQDSLGPRDWLTSVSRNFLATYRRHMRMEDAFLFPLAEKHLSADDWRELDARLSDYQADPLFSPATAKRFEALLAYIKSLEVLEE